MLISSTVENSDVLESNTAWHADAIVELCSTLTYQVFTMHAAVKENLSTRKPEKQNLLAFEKLKQLNSA